MLIRRVSSAIIGVMIFLTLCFGGLLPAAIGATTVTLLASWEWICVFRRVLKLETSSGDIAPLPRWWDLLNLLFALSGSLLPLLAYLLMQGPTAHTPSERPIPNATALLVLPILVFMVLTWRAMRHYNTTGHILDSARRWYGPIGMIYIGLPMSSMVWLRGLASVGNVATQTFPHYVPVTGTETGAWLLLFVAVCVWMTDTGAYAVGKTLGRRQLSHLSPGKTMEGALGGFCAALSTGAGFGLWLHLPLRDGLAVGLIAGVLGQFGDLFESALKRELGTKDFGSIMPGHGGALDRFDSLLFVAPIAFCYLHFLGGH